MTPNFSAKELACRCGCGMLPQQQFMDKVQVLRERYGKPLTVTSAARCATHNTRVSSTGATGPHVTGRAIDFGVRGAECYALLKIALEMGFTGIGVAARKTANGPLYFLHVDDLPNGPGCPRPFVWGY